MNQPTLAPPLILVVGMHRSGTSLLASLLENLGIPTPGPLIQADVHNPEGYHERQDVITLQEDLLIRLGRWWPSQSGVEPLPAPWMQHPAALAAKGKLKQLLKVEMGRQSGPWAVKDPRSSLLLPLWKEVAGQLDLPIRLVLAVRDPAEVMTSLLTRDRDAAGMTNWRAQQLWWRHHRSVLLECGDLPVHVVHYSRWFTPHRDNQLEALLRFCWADTTRCTVDSSRALERVCTEYRRSRRWRHAPIHPKIHRLERRLLAVADGREDLNSVKVWLMAQPDPLALPLASWRRGSASAALQRRSAWTGAARALGVGQTAVRLHRWHQQGGPDPQDLAFLALLPAAETPTPTGVGPLANQRWNVLGANERHWWVHVWLQQLPVAPADLRTLAEGELASDREPLLHLQSLETTISEGRLASLQTCPVVFDPCRTRVRQMRWLGIRAQHLQPRPYEHGSGWLNHNTDQPAINSRLGLPDPESLTDPSELRFLVLGKNDVSWEQRLQHPFWNLPGFDALQLENAEDARLLASWLQRCQDVGLQLVRLQPSPLEQDQQAWTALSAPIQAQPGWQGPQLFRDPIGQDELRRELEWRRMGRQPPSPECSTPEPDTTTLWSSVGGSRKATATVCISLYNYAERITQALDSVLNQTHQDLELVVVDDHSSDGGEQRTLHWMEQHSARFSRTLLLRHSVNAGLAAARNTAFAVARGAWCFVLDADNQLLPEAVEACLQVASHADPATAVVHPLVELRVEGASDSARTLLSDVSWQREQFRRGNVVDAMALIRRQAWHDCGGYAHIPGGWEDFDFWCQLMEAGWHGVICPQRLGIYNSHANSMLTSATHQRARSLSRLMQVRHPWLQLSPADPDA